MPLRERLLRLEGVYDVPYDACMFGGARLKHQRLRGSFPELQSMAKLCDGNHEHLPYTRDEGGWSTAQEAEYPIIFCVKLVECAAAALVRQGYSFAEPKFVDNQYRDVQQSVLIKIAAWKQPRGMRSPQLISEFLEVRTVPWAAASPVVVNSKRLTTHEIKPEAIVIPAGSKL